MRIDHGFKGDTQSEAFERLIATHTDADESRARAKTRVTVWNEADRPHCDILRAAAPSLTRLVEGATPEAAIRAASQLLGDERWAQEGAARAALGAPQPEGVAQAIACEALDAQAHRLLALPRMLGLPPAPQIVTLRDADGRPRLSAQPEALSEALFGRAGPPLRLRAFESWIASGETPLARAYAMLWKRCDARWGRADLALWTPACGTNALDWGSADCAGAPVEAGVAARVCDSDLPRAIEARRGRGMVWRMVARLTDVARLIRAARDGVGAPPLSPAPGVGVALSARGPVLLRARLRADGRVATLERLDAGAFALHRGGALAQALTHLPHRDAAQLRMAAKLVIDSVDVGPVRLEIAESASV